MKTKLLVIAGLLLIACAAMVAPVSAVDATASANVTGNPSQYASMSINLSSMTMDLQATGTAHNQTPALTVTANAPFTINARDSGVNGKVNTGHMENYTSGAYSAPHDYLASAMTVSGTLNGTVAATNTNDLAGASGTLYTGSAAIANTVLALDFAQPVAVTDKRLQNAGSVYAIDITFTLTVP